MYRQPRVSSTIASHDVANPRSASERMETPLIEEIISLHSQESNLDNRMDVATKHSSKLKAAPKGSGWLSKIRCLNWRLGILSGCAASTIVLIINIALLLTGIFSRYGVEGGIGTITQGSSSEISTMSTAYHALINVLSTLLLTSSNYCMQVLCSPTRDEVDNAHLHGRWLDVGIMSLENLKFIGKRRKTLFIILAISSLPLHLIYNSAIFEVAKGQDYRVFFVDDTNNSLLSTLASNMTNLTNSQWGHAYDTQYTTDYKGDLYLVVDQVSALVQLNSSISWNSTPVEGSNGMPKLPNGSRGLDFSSALAIGVDPSSGELILTGPPNVTVECSLEAYHNSWMPPVELPGSIYVDVSVNKSIFEAILYNKNGSWSGNYRIAYGFSTPNKDASSVQVAISFMVVVICCNLVKSIAMWLTYKETTSNFLVTTGDAVASFLENPDMTTVGKCTYSQKLLKDGVDHTKVTGADSAEIWKPKKTRLALLWLRRTWSSSAILILMGILAILALIFAFPSKAPGDTDIDPFQWGTASSLQLGIAARSFDARGLLVNTFLANAPQVLLSVSYFTMNRMVTSISSADEWNRLATSRKTLRVSNPEGDQRSTYFLSLPYRWAVPLTVVSCFLHWLLSQSIFLVRLEIRDTSGLIKPDDSKSTCGYSAFSIFIFVVSYLVLLVIILAIMLRPFEERLPFAGNCSLVISAACHPPPEDVDAHLNSVKWGVVRSRYGGTVAHCTVTSEEVQSPVVGRQYA